jgi:hypothetical protein
MTHVRNVSPGIDGSSVSGTVNFTSSICKASSSCLKNWVEEMGHHTHITTTTTTTTHEFFQSEEEELAKRSSNSWTNHKEGSSCTLSEAVSCKASERIPEFCLRDLQARMHQEKRREKRRYIVRPITHV